MKAKLKTNIFLILCLIALWTPAVEANQDQLATSMRDARAEAARTADQLRTTLETLTALTKQTKGDLRPAYEAFAKELPRTQAAAAETAARIRWMENEGLNYFKQWQQTTDSIANESLRKKAQKRLDAAKKNYDKVGRSLKAAQEKFQPFLSDLNDIQKALSQDVTASGVKNIRNTVSDANWRYRNVNSQIRDTLKEIDKTAKALSTETT